MLLVGDETGQASHDGARQQFVQKSNNYMHVLA